MFYLFLAERQPHVNTHMVWCVCSTRRGKSRSNYRTSFLAPHTHRTSRSCEKERNGCPSCHGMLTRLGGKQHLNLVSGYEEWQGQLSDLMPVCAHEIPSSNPSHPHQEKASESPMQATFCSWDCCTMSSDTQADRLPIPPSHTISLPPLTLPAPRSSRGFYPRGI